MTATEHECEYRARVRELEAELATQRDQLSTQSEQLQGLESQLAALQRQVFGRKSERVPPVSKELRAKRKANDAEAQAKRAERREKQTELVATERTHRVDEDKRTCPNCDHDMLKPMGNGRRSPTYDYVPGILMREVHVQEVLSCTTCDYVVRADPPKKAFAGTRYGPGLMAHIITAKCADSMPIHRLEKQFKRADVPLSKSTMNDLLHRGARELASLSRRLQDLVAQADVVQADETPVKIQGRKSKGQMWTFVADAGGADLISYRFSSNRSGETPLQVLGGTTGTLVVDAYTGYNSVTDVDGRERAGCMAHTRRKFFEALPSAAKAQEAIDLIRELYRVEHDAREQGIVGSKRHLELRQSRSRPLMAKLRAWLVDNRGQSPPKSAMGTAIAYAVNNRDALERFLEKASIPIDNNASERALRRVAIGRKNFLFVGHDEAGQNLAGLYSLVATCEANGINPETYLADVLLRLDDHPAAKIDDLLPHRWEPVPRPLPEWVVRATAG